MKLTTSKTTVERIVKDTVVCEASLTMTGEEFEALREDLRKLFSQEGYSTFPALSKLEDVLGGL